MSGWADYPTCPSCGFVDQDWWDGLPSKVDGDSWEWTCECGAVCTITMSLEASFDTERKE